MRMLNVHDDSQHFFRELAAAKRRVLVVDYDSVIAPLSVAAQATLPYPTIGELLDCIMTTSRTRVVFITDRKTTDVLPSAPGPAPDIWAGSDSFTSGSCYRSVPSLTTTPDDLIASVLNGDGEDTAVAYLTEGHGLYAAVTQLAEGDDRVACFHPMMGQGAREQNFVQFLVDWLRVCGGEIC